MDGAVARNATAPFLRESGAITRLRVFGDDRDNARNLQSVSKKKKKKILKKFKLPIDIFHLWKHNILHKWNILH